jgi:uncharacterized membrane protein (UPF0182 family)
MDLMFALQVLAGIIGFAIGMAISGLFAAIWLRLAARWLRFGDVPYFTAFKSVLISNFVIFTLNCVIGVNHSLMMANPGQMFSGQRSRPVEFTFAYWPNYFLYMTVFGLLVTAAIFCRTIPDKDTDSRITFGDSFALTSFYFALAFGFMLLLGLLAFCIVSVFVP